MNITTTALLLFCLAIPTDSPAQCVDLEGDSGCSNLEGVPVPAAPRASSPPGHTPSPLSGQIIHDLTRPARIAALKAQIHDAGHVNQLDNDMDGSEASVDVAGLRRQLREEYAAFGREIDQLAWAYTRTIAAREGDAVLPAELQCVSPPGGNATLDWFRRSYARLYVLERMHSVIVSPEYMDYGVSGQQAYEKGLTTLDAVEAKVAADLAKPVHHDRNACSVPAAVLRDQIGPNPNPDLWVALLQAGSYARRQAPNRGFQLEDLRALRRGEPQREVSFGRALSEEAIDGGAAEAVSDSIGEAMAGSGLSDWIGLVGLAKDLIDVADSAAWDAKPEAERGALIFRAFVEGRQSDHQYPDSAVAALGVWETRRADIIAHACPQSGAPAVSRPAATRP
jgi:hypothetical protein